MKLLNKLTKNNEKTFEITETPDGMFGIKERKYTIPNLTDDKEQLERIVDLLNGLKVTDNSRVFELAVRCLRFKEIGTFSVIKTGNTYGIAYEDVEIKDLTTKKDNALQIKEMLNGIVEKDYDTINKVIKMYIDYEDLI